MLCQASTATVFSSCLFLGHFPFSFVFSKWNACSIGFRSGDWLGHCITVHFFPFKNSLVAFAVCFGSLSICTVKRRPMSSEAFGWIWADNIARNTSEFILLLLSVVTSSINTREPVPLAAIHAHATTTMLHWWGGMLRIMSSSLPSQFWNNILWTDETKINLYQSDGKRRVWRRKETAHDPKHPKHVMQWPSQSPDLNPIEHAFHLLKTKLKGKCPKNKQELKTVAVEAWQSITRDETQRLVMSMRSSLQAVIDCKGFATKY